MTSSAMLGCRRSASAGASAAWQRFGRGRTAKSDVDAARERAYVDRLQRTVRHRTTADGVRPASLDAVTAPGGELAGAHRSGAQIGREHRAVGDLRRAHRAAGVAVSERTAALLRSALATRAVLDLLAGDRCPCGWRPPSMRRLGLGGAAERDEQGDEGDDHRGRGAAAYDAHVKDCGRSERPTIAGRRMLHARSADVARRRPGVGSTSVNAPSSHAERVRKPR